MQSKRKLSYRQLRLHGPWVAAIVALVGGSILSTDRPFSDCRIKGNISYNTGERIFHTPTQQFYDETVITSSKGERWFCTEDEARNAGWRKSKR